MSRTVEKYFTVIFVLMVNTASLEAQNADKLKFVGVSLQGYPAGLISSFHYRSSRDSVNFLYARMGVNLTNRRDFSPVNDFEKGRGFGVSVGFFRYLRLKRGSLFAAPILDIWNMWIHWENNRDQQNFTQGDSFAFVVQPWLDIGYSVSVSDRLHIAISTGFGREINTITRGRAVGQGWVNSVSLSLHSNLN